VTEILANGKEHPSCQKNVTNEKHYPGKQFCYFWIYNLHTCKIVVLLISIIHSFVVEIKFIQDTYIHIF